MLQIRAHGTTTTTIRMGMGRSNKAPAPAPAPPVSPRVRRHFTVERFRTRRLPLLFGQRVTTTATTTNLYKHAAVGPSLLPV